MAPANPSVLIVGHGEMGQAMELLLRRHSPRVWQRRDGRTALADAARAAATIVLCVPALAVAELGVAIGDSGSSALVVTLSKGLDTAGRTPVEILAEALGPGRFAALYGPMISEEIRAGRPAYAECGSDDPQACARLAALFAGSRLHLAPAADLAGLAWAAILKNVYALAFGMSDALELGDNARGFLAVTAVHEIDRVVRRQGSPGAGAFGLAGLGDLITTATSRGSNHYALGGRLARGDRGELRGEGIHTLAVLRRTARLATDELPLLRLIDACVQEPGRAAARLRAFLGAGDPAPA